MTGAAAWQRAYRQRRAAGRAVFQVEADLFALAEALVASNFLAHPSQHGATLLHCRQAPRAERRPADADRARGRL
jgi:hypothetical protein